MLISPSPFNPELSIITVLLLIFFLVMYEILSLNHKDKLQKVLISLITAFLCAFVFVLIHRFEVILG